MGENKDYKGFAYINGSDKPYILYGNSEDYIISRLQNFNRARTEQQRYVSVNIGVLVDQKETAQVRYENYKKYDVATGRDISPVYLRLPSLPKEEFVRLTEQIKAEGAKYNPHKKRWYALPDEVDRFKEYLNDSPQNRAEVIDIQKELQEMMIEEEPQKDVWENRHGIIDLEAKYTLTLQDGRQITVSAGDLPAEYQNKTVGDMLQGMDIALDQVLSRPELSMDMEKTESGEYILDVSKEMEINECTVYFPDGRDPMTLYGDQFGVSFSSLSKEEAQELVDNYLLNQADPYQIEDQLEYVLGRTITAYAFDSESHLFYKLEGMVFDHNDTQVMLKFEEDKICDNIPEEYMMYEKETLYSGAQKKWIEDVMKLDVPAASYKFMYNSTYTSAQLEALAESFKDGLRPEQIKSFADPQIASWKMDLYRIGMQHGISAEQLQDLTQKSVDWVTGREEITGVINEHRKVISQNIVKSGFQPTPEIVRKMEHLNHLTGRENTIKDVCIAFKQGVYKDDEKLDRLVKDLGREFQMQEMTMKQMPIQ